MKRRQYTLALTLTIDDQDEGAGFPSDDQLCAVLAYSAAAEALVEATGCGVCLELVGRHLDT
jgi:hypothetical protein